MQSKLRSAQPVTLDLRRHFEQRRFWLPQRAKAVS